MKKKILSAALVFTMLLTLVPVTAWADGTSGSNAAKIGDQYFLTLAAAIEAAGPSDTVTVLSDVDLGSGRFKISKAFTLDLNGYTISGSGADVLILNSSSCSILIKNGTIRNTSTEKECDAIWIQGAAVTLDHVSVECCAPTAGGYNYAVAALAFSVDGFEHTSVTLQNGCVIHDISTSTQGAASGYLMGIKLQGRSQEVGVGRYAESVCLTMDDSCEINTSGFCIGGNGDSHGTNITINGSTLTSTGSHGIYHPQAGVLTINGAAITGAETGVEIRAGELNVMGNASITGNGAPLGVTPNGSGTTSAGAGIAVAQHTTKLPITVNISNASISGYSALYESNPQKNDPDSLAKITLSITGGNFKAINGGTVSIYSEDNTGFITGGYFSSDPSAYVAADNTAVESDLSGYAYMVTEKTETPAEVVAAPPAVTVPSGLSEDEAKTAKEVKDALETAENVVTGDGLTAAANTVANQNTTNTEYAKQLLTDAGLDANSATVTVVVQPYMDIQIKGVEEAEGAKTITLDITPMYKTVATTADLAQNTEIKTDGGDRNAVEISGATGELTITRPVTITIPLPDGFVEGTDGSYPDIYINHVKDNGRTFIYTAKVSKTGDSLFASFENPNGFSTFAVTTKNTAAAEIGSVGYTSLQAAVDAVQNGETIKILSDGQTAAVSRTVSFTVAPNGKTYTINLGANCVNRGTGDAYNVVYTAPSGGSAAAYAITVERADNGSVTVSRTSAAAGVTVTVTLAPAEGCTPGTLAVTDKDGNSVTLTKASDTQYTFTMPASAVSVKAVFSGEWANPFTDVSADDWFYPAVKYAAQNGLMAGTSAAVFSPDLELTRGTMVTILWGMEGQPTPAAASGFGDVASGAWYSGAVNWAAGAGIVCGYSRDQFGPEDSITREQMAAMLYAYAAYKGMDTTQGGMATREFSDYDEISGWAMDAMTWAVNTGLIGGKPGQLLDPAGGASRAEAATILTNFASRFPE